MRVTKIFMLMALLLLLTVMGFSKSELNYEELSLTELAELADQGDAKAQFNLGLMYDFGIGVVQNYEQAYFWYLLAAANADAELYEDASHNRDLAAKELSSAQRQRIQREAAAWEAN